MNRAVGRCSARIETGPRQVFLFFSPSPSILKSNGTGEEIGQGTKTPSPAQCTGRGQSFVLLAPLSHLLSALSASSLFYLVQVDLSCLVLHCLALPCLALSCLASLLLPLLLPPTRRHHIRTPRQHCPVARPTSKFVRLPPKQGRRANAAPSPVELQRPSFRSTPSQLRNNGLLAGQ